MPNSYTITRRNPNTKTLLKIEDRFMKCLGKICTMLIVAQLDKCLKFMAFRGGGVLL